MKALRLLYIMIVCPLSIPFTLAFMAIVFIFGCFDAIRYKSLDMVMACLMGMKDGFKISYATIKHFVLYGNNYSLEEL